MQHVDNAYVSNLHAGDIIDISSLVGYTIPIWAMVIKLEEGKITTQLNSTYDITYIHYVSSHCTLHKLMTAGSEMVNRICYLKHN